MPYDDRDDEDLDISVPRRGRGGPGEHIPNYLTQAILVTLCCCWPFGIVAIIQAAKVNTLVAEGDYEAARRASDSAKTWCLVSFILGGLAIGFWIVVQVIAEANRPGVHF